MWILGPGWCQIGVSWGMSAESHTTLVAILVVLGASGCRHSVPVDRSRLLEVGRYHETGSVTVNDAGKEVAFDRGNAPNLRLRLKRSCSFWQILNNRCDKLVLSALDDVRVVDGRLLLRVKTSVLLGTKRDVRVDIAEVESAALEVKGYTPRSFSPRFGLGFSVLGPSGIVGLGFQYLPSQWLALELTALPAADVLALSAGMRIRPWALGPVRPFIGAFGHYGAAFEVATGDSVSLAVVGPRAGLDIELGRGRGLLTLEFDLPRLVHGDSFYGDLRGPFIPWGGATISVLF